MKESNIADLPIEKKYLFPREEMLAIIKEKNTLIIGLPKENQEYENRIALTPLSVKMLIDQGHQVILEDGAGTASNYSNRAYAEVGATITHDKENIFSADILIKIAPLNLQEIALLKNNQLVISSLYLAAQKKECFKMQMQKKVTGIAFEYLEDSHKNLPLVSSMSEISGSTAVLIASEYLSSTRKGRGIMLGGIAGINPTKIVVLGADTAGESAARTAIGLGATVKVFDNSIHKLRQLSNKLGHKVSTSVLSMEVLGKSVQTAEVIIGTIRHSKNLQGFIVPEDLIMKMKKNAVIIDLTIEMGGNFETSKITNQTYPTYIKHGVIHYCVPNITSRVARTASMALGNILAPLLLKIAQSGSLDRHINKNINVRNGIYMYNGIITDKKISEVFDLPYRNIELLLATL